MVHISSIALAILGLVHALGLAQVDAVSLKLRCSNPASLHPRWRTKSPQERIEQAWKKFEKIGEKNASSGPETTHRAEAAQPPVPARSEVEVLHPATSPASVEAADAHAASRTAERQQSASRLGSGSEGHELPAPVGTGRNRDPSPVGTGRSRDQYLITKRVIVVICGMVLVAIIVVETKANLARLGRASDEFYNNNN